MKLIYFVFLIFFVSCVVTKNKKHPLIMNNIAKWKKAVIHLECTGDSKGWEARDAERDKNSKLLDEGKITSDEYRRLMDADNSRDVRIQGTAIFLKKNEKYYLLTARHVVWDKLEASRRLTKIEQQVQSLPNYNLRDKERDEKDLLNLIASLIFRVSSIDEAVKPDFKNTRNEGLMNLRSGPDDFRPYTFSEPGIDLAIIELREREKWFADQLINAGYEPITPDDISSEPLVEGQDVMAVGFPGATALITEIKLTRAEENWASKYVSAPVYSFGKVAMQHNALSFFWTDLSIYPGNSGGPIISNNKLIGIVSAQGVIPIEGLPNTLTRIPFGKIIMIKHVLELMEAHEKKQERWLKFTSGMRN